MISMSGISTGARGLIPKSTGGRVALASAGILTAGYAGQNAYANGRDASQINMYGATMLSGYGGTAALMRNRKKQGHPLFTRPGNVNNHLFPGGGDQGIG
jgi:hypothetical protein